MFGDDRLTGDRSLLSKNSTKVLTFILKNSANQIVPCENTTKEVLFEWSHRF